MRRAGKGQRKGGRERGTREREVQKKTEGEGEREWSQRADTACGCGGSDLVMEGDKFSGKTNSQPTCFYSEWTTKCKVLQSAFLLL